MPARAANERCRLHSITGIWRTTRGTSLCEPTLTQFPMCFAARIIGFTTGWKAQIDSRKIRGVICWRQLSCDLWHAEFERMRQSLPVPVLDIDAADGDERSQARILGRIEAFVEMLQ